MEGTQMEMFNFLWLIWDQYLPLAPTRKDLHPWHPLHRCKFTQKANLLGKTVNKKSSLTCSRLIQHQQNVILKPRWAGNKNRYRCQGTFVFLVLCSKFAFWVNLHPPCRCQGGQSFLVGVKGRYWSQISHRKLNISIWVPFILVKSPKDHLLKIWVLEFLVPQSWDNKWGLARSLPRVTIAQKARIY